MKAWINKAKDFLNQSLGKVPYKQAIHYSLFALKKQLTLKILIFSMFLFDWNPENTCKILKIKNILFALNNNSIL